MTTGQLLFYGGVTLLGLTIVLAIVFIIVKPKYKPESGTYDGADPDITQKLLNGYPTDRMTIRRESPRPSDPEETELLFDDRTEPMPETEQIEP